MSEEERSRDEALAAFTDAILEGQTEKRDRPPLADTVETLARALSPEQQPEGLGRNVRRGVASAWEQEHASPRRPLSSLFGRPAQRWAWALAAGCALVGLAVAVLLPTGALETTGTAAGKGGAMALGAALALVGAVAAMWLLYRSRKGG